MMHGQNVHQNGFSGFSGKILIQSKLAILGPKMVHLHNSGATLTVFSKPCTMKGANR